MPRKLRRPKLRLERPALSTLQRRVLLYGIRGLVRPDQDPTVSHDDLGKTFEWTADDGAMKAAWVLHRDALLLEWASTHGDGSRPWAAEQFEREAMDDDER